MYMQSNVLAARPQRALFVSSKQQAKWIADDTDELCGSFKILLVQMAWTLAYIKKILLK